MYLKKKMSLTPTTVTHALDVPTFYKQHEQFWHMLTFLFTEYKNQTVWKQLHPETYSKMAMQLEKVINGLSSEQHLLNRKELFFHAYFVIVEMTRRNQTVAEWMGSSSSEFLTSMHNMYRILYTIQSHLPNLPLFGHSHENIRRIN